MTNEAKLLVETGLPLSFTVENTVGIEKGASLILVDPHTVSGASTSNQPMAGFAAKEKIATDGRVHQSVYREGIWRVFVSGSVTVGDALVTADSLVNMFKVQPAFDTISGANVALIALESASTGESIKAELKPFNVKFA